MKENETYPLSEWRFEVSQKNTVLGYQEWVDHNLAPDLEELLDKANSQNRELQNEVAELRAQQRPTALEVKISNQRATMNTAKALKRIRTISDILRWYDELIRVGESDVEAWIERGADYFSELEELLLEK